MCISSNEYKDRKLNLNLDDLVYNKTYEEEMEEKRKIDLAISHLEGFGVEVKTEYGYYRNIYNVLKDLGECLAKTQEYNSSLLTACRKYLGEE